MKPSAHVIISSLVSVALFKISGALKAAFSCFVSGVFIDADHFFDYYVTYKKLDRIGVVYRRLSETRIRFLFVLLHSYELCALLWLSALFFNMNDILFGVALGFTTHIVTDQIGLYKSVRLCTYFFLCRLIRRFRVKDLFQTGSFSEPEV